MMERVKLVVIRMGTQEMAHVDIFYTDQKVSEVVVVRKEIIHG